MGSPTTSNTVLTRQPSGNQGEQLEPMSASEIRTCTQEQICLGILETPLKLVTTLNTGSDDFPAMMIPWNDDSPAKTQQQPMVSLGCKVVRTDLVHPQYVHHTFSDADLCLVSSGALQIEGPSMLRRGAPPIDPPGWFILGSHFFWIPRVLTRIANPFASHTLPFLCCPG